MPRQKSFDPEVALRQMTLVFWDKGYMATSMSDLEHATGLNKKSLYNAFGDKPEIFDKVVSGYVKNAVGMTEVLQRKPLGVDNIRAFFSMMKYEPGSRGCLLTKSINQRDLIEPETFEKVECTIQQVENLFYKNLLATFRRKRKAKRLAAFLTSSMQGITTMAALDPDPERLEHVTTSIFSLLESEAD